MHIPARMRPYRGFEAGMQMAGRKSVWRAPGATSTETWLIPTVNASLRIVNVSVVSVVQIRHLIGYFEYLRDCTFIGIDLWSKNSNIIFFFWNFWCDDK